MVERKTNKEEFAAKIFDKNLIMSDPMEKKCLLYEISMLREMNHHRVCKLYELYEGENYIYCLNELYNGSTLLDAIIKKGFQPEKKSLKIIFQIIEGLAYMHSKNIIHRDLKPENIIFKDSDNKINLGLVDFGFATYEKDYKLLFTRCGTPGYVAPEVLNDLPYNCKADIFSCGVIFYMILTGKIPFNGNSYREIVMKNMKGDVDFNPKSFDVFFTETTMSLLKGLLEKDPKKRLTADEALNHPAFSLIEESSPIKKGKNFNDNFGKFSEFTGDKFNLKQNKISNNTDIPDDLDELNSPDNSPVAHKKKQKKEFTTFNLNPIEN